MKNKDKDFQNEFIYDESQNLNKSIKQDFELFHDEDNVPGSVIRVKRVVSRNGAEDWNIFCNEKNVICINGYRFNNKEKEFLRSVDGILYLINGWKSGWRSVSDFKRNLP